ncbi:sn-glycerol-1-phosphate dehydrogenase [Salisediminibacterium beveridgei]|nr:sn-glycerol-1-phosphate dehydrogenase [Salisediminibacterium beveridgei]
MEELTIKSGATDELRSYLLRKKWMKVHVVYDRNTRTAAGDQVVDQLTVDNIHIGISEIEEDENQDVIADEAAIMQVLTEVDHETDVLMAVGAGTLHDITRYAAYTLGKPFISIPTAPSVDGFNSMGAPIVLKKKKKTFQTQTPIALFADVDVLKEAPTDMTAAGFGDVLGKYTALADWHFGAITANEPFCDQAAEMTLEALNQAIQSAKDIRAGSAKGMENLFEALLKSGMAMSLFGHSHPASGGEHHLSHYWEMGFLAEGRKQLLHGEKIGVSTGLIADIYHEHVEKKVALDPLLTDAQKERIALIFKDLPTGDDINTLLGQVGGKTTLAELGVEEVLYQESIHNAHTLRKRNTMLRYLNERE